MKHLYFCRHGESEANVAGVWSGQLETPLTANGRKQAKAAGQAAKDIKIDHIMCSPLSRAHDTAKIIAGEIGFPLDALEINSLLIERHFGQMEGQPWSIDTDVDGFIDAETQDSVMNRAHLVLEHLETLPYDNILVVSHGSFGRALRTMVFPDFPFIQGDPATRFPNAQIVQLI